VFGIEKFRVDGFRSQKFTTNNKYLRRDIPSEASVNTTDAVVECESVPRGRGFRSLDFAEQLVENPDEVVVVPTTKHLCDKCSPFNKELHSKF